MIESKRYLNEMMEMYGLPSELYTMQRRTKKKGDLDYDITIIPPLIINGHYNRTKGHIHSSGHEEIYIVLEGETLVQFQNDKECFYRKVKKGGKIIIPGNYHHLHINPGKKILKLGNWVSEKCIRDYKYLEKMKGMAYYYTTKGWVKNPNYKKYPKLKSQN